jgi:hypothetical protein
VAVPADDEVFHLLWIKGPVGADDRGVQETKELCERLVASVVRGGRGQDEGLGVGGEDAGELVVEGGCW